MFIWRGYKACVSSNLPKMSTRELGRRFDLAMESIKKMEKEREEDVFFQPTQPTQSSTIPARQAVSSSSSGTQHSSSSSSRSSSQTLESEEPTQIPETQFDMGGNLFFLKQKFESYIYIYKV